jgi:hypothetical protein
MDLAININDSQKASFTPIRICSVPADAKESVNRNIATITVV